MVPCRLTAASFDTRRQVGTCSRLSHVHYISSSHTPLRATAQSLLEHASALLITNRSRRRCSYVPWIVSQRIYGYAYDMIEQRALIQLTRCVLATEV